MLGVCAYLETVSWNRTGAKRTVSRSPENMLVIRTSKGPRENGTNFCREPSIRGWNPNLCRSSIEYSTPTQRGENIQRMNHRTVVIIKPGGHNYYHLLKPKVASRSLPAVVI